MKEYKYKMLISYDGTNYFGWQIQKNKLTIQEAIQKRLSKILREDIKIIAAGRTDAKVHALEQVAHFSFNERLDIKKVIFSLNSLLPDDIRIKKITEVDINFHARFSAKSKIYRYHIFIGDIQDPFSRMYSYKPNYTLDLDLLKKASIYFLGTHNFSSFANKQYTGSAVNKPIKTIKRIDIKKSNNGIILEFEADGFLYKMVRNIVGTLLDVANKKLPLDMVDKILKAKDRKKASPPAEPQGLFLVKVLY
ncbi:MAG: tRNA pseudouridine synthase A [Candidatus Anoxychlamydiales bacterium]|nr:tRNA pseudouridine synthase A [Candidatus Anoxychlamydiales bacterium]